MTTRVLGIDPGLTRFGYGIIDVHNTRTTGYVTSGVFTSSAQTDVSRRVHEIAEHFRTLISEYRPTRISLERIFAQQNLNTVMPVAFISGVVLDEAVKHNIDINFYTPTQVKAQVSGYGKADKKQVAHMVARLLRLQDFSVVADESDALALALCDVMLFGKTAASVNVSQHKNTAATAPVASSRGLTPAQQLWLQAERRQKK